MSSEKARHRKTSNGRFHSCVQSEKVWPLIRYNGSYQRPGIMCAGGRMEKSRCLGAKQQRGARNSSMLRHIRTGGNKNAVAI
jgi:hypothetical protein